MNKVMDLFFKFCYLFPFAVGSLGFEFCVFVTGWRHALQSEWPFVMIIFKWIFVFEWLRLPYSTLPSRIDLGQAGTRHTPPHPCSAMHFKGAPSASAYYETDPLPWSGVG